MRRQINSRLVLRTIVAVVAAVLIIVAAGRLLRRIALGNVLPRARAMAEKEHYDKAFELYAIHLQAHPDDVAALAEYADLMVQGGRAHLAAEVYRRILTFHPEESDKELSPQEMQRVCNALLNLAAFEARMAARARADAPARWAEVEKFGARIVKAAPDNPYGYLYSAQAQIFLGKFEEAQAALQKLLASHPKDKIAYFLLANLAERKGRPSEEWLPYIDQLLENNQESWSAHLEAYAFLDHRGIAGAVKNLEKALRLAPNEPTVLMYAAFAQERAAEEHEGKGDFDTARKSHQAACAYWKKMSSLDTLAYLPHYRLAAYALKNGDVEGAIEQLRTGLNKCTASDELILRYHLVDILLDQERREEARRELDRLRERAPRSPFATYLDGRVLLDEGELEEARHLLERARTEYLSLEENFELKVRRDSFTVPMIREYSKVLNMALFKNNLDLGVCRLRQGDPGLARTSFEAALERNPVSVRARALLCSALLGCGETEAAVEEARTAVSEAKKAGAADARRPHALFALARALRAASGGPEADKALQAQAIEVAQEAARLRPAAGILALLAQLYREAGRLEEAEATLRREPADPSDTSKIQQELLRFYCGTGQLVRARQLHADMVRGEGNTVELRLLAAHLFPQSLEELRAELEKMLDEASDEEIAAVRQDLALLRIAQGNHEKAAEQLKAISAAAPGDVFARRLLLRIAYELDDLELAKATIHELAKLEGEGSPDVICYRAECSLLEARNRGDRQAAGIVVQKLQRLGERAPSSRAWKTLGDAYIHAGDIVEASRCYRKALEANPSDLLVGALLVDALTKAGQDGQANAEMDRLIAMARGSILAHDLQYERHRRERNVDAAIETMEKRQKIRQLDDVTTLLRHGQLLRHIGKLDEAEMCFRRAHELRPHTRETVLALASLLRETEREAEALQLLDRFVTARPGDSTALRCRAEYYYKICGKHKEATDDLLLALKRDAKDKETLIMLGEVAAAEGKQREAIQWHAKAAALEPPGARARRILAVSLLATKKRQDTEEANRKIIEVLNETPDDPDAHLIKATLDMVGPDRLQQARQHCLRAIDLLPRNAAAHFQLSQICLAENDLRGAAEQASRALQYAPGLLPAILTRVASLKRQGRYDEAEVVLDGAPRTLGVTLARADLIDTRHGPGRAAEFVRARISDLREDSPTEFRLRLLLRLAHYMIKAGDLQEAETHLRAACELSKGSYEPVAVLARLLNQNKRFDDADKLLDETTPEQSAPASIKFRLLRADLLVGRGRAADLAEADRLARAVLTQQPGSSDALRIRGDIAYHNGNAAESEQLRKAAAEQAIKLQEEALDADIRNHMAMNTLACSLARLGRYAEALPYARNAAYQAPEVANYLDTLGDVSYHLGNYEESRRALVRCVKLSARAPQYQYRLGRTLLKLKRTGEGGQALKQAMELDKEARKLSPEEREAIRGMMAEIKEFQEQP